MSQLNIHNFLSFLSFMLMALIISPTYSATNQKNCDSANAVGSINQCDCDNLYCYGRNEVILNVKSATKNSGNWQFKCAGERTNNSSEILFGFSAHGSDWNGFCKTKKGWTLQRAGQDYDGNLQKFLDDFWAHTKKGDRLPIHFGWLERTQEKSSNAVNEFEGRKNSTAIYKTPNNPPTYLREIDPIHYIYNFSGNRDFINMISAFFPSNSMLSIPAIPNQYRSHTNNNFKANNEYARYLSSDAAFNQMFLGLVLNIGTNKVPGTEVEFTVHPGVKIFKCGQTIYYFDLSQHAPSVFAGHCTPLAKYWMQNYPKLAIPITSHYRPLSTDSDSILHRYNSPLQFCTYLNRYKTWLKEDGSLGYSFTASSNNHPESQLPATLAYSKSLFCNAGYISEFNGCNTSGVLHLSQATPIVYGKGDGHCSIYFISVSKTEDICSNAQLNLSGLDSGNSPSSCISAIPIGQCRASSGVSNKFCYSIPQFFQSEAFTANCSSVSSTGCLNAEKNFYSSTLAAAQEVVTESRQTDTVLPVVQPPTEYGGACDSTIPCGQTISSESGTTLWCRSLNSHNNYKWVSRQICTNGRIGDYALCGGSRQKCIQGTNLEWHTLPNATCAPTTPCDLIVEERSIKYWCRNLNGNGYDWTPRYDCTAARINETAQCGGKSYKCISGTGVWTALP